MFVKLQPASGTNLPPYNPLLPPPAVSQVLILANPQQVSLGSVLNLHYLLIITLQCVCSMWLILMLKESDMCPSLF